jgi:PAS domain-containing protein
MKQEPKEADVSQSLPDAGYFRAIIDAIPSPLFVVDNDVRILDCNEAGRAFLGSASNPLLTRAGEILHCINAVQAPGGCGTGPECKACVVRQSVGESFKARKITRRAQRMVQKGGE